MYIERYRNCIYNASSHKSKNDPPIKYNKPFSKQTKSTINVISIFYSKQKYYYCNIFHY